MKQYNKPRKSYTLFGLGSLDLIPSPWLCFLKDCLANHFASTDNKTRTTKRKNTYCLFAWCSTDVDFHGLVICCLELHSSATLKKNQIYNISAQSDAPVYIDIL